MGVGVGFNVVDESMGLDVVGLGGTIFSIGEGDGMSPCSLLGLMDVGNDPEALVGFIVG